MSAKTALGSAGPIIHGTLPCENIRTGERWPRPDLQAKPLPTRFWAKVERKSDAECWPFLGARNQAGYGIMRPFGRRKVAAHRVAWQLANGPLPKGAILRHSCDNPSCVNPSHLVVGTHADNVADRVRRGRSAVGERSGRAKLTPDAVRAIRLSSDSTSVLAQRFGVTHCAVLAVRRGESWKHVSVEGAA